MDPTTPWTAFWFWGVRAVAVAGEKVAEQLVRPIHQMDDHGETGEATV
jgi:hypothetical protein